MDHVNSIIPGSIELFTLHKHPTLSASYGKPWLIRPFGDVHHDSANHNSKVWRAFLNEAKADLDQYEGRVLFLGMGDYGDFASSSERYELSAAKTHDGTKDRLDRLAKQDADSFLRDILFMKDRMIGLIEGNHHWVFQNGMTSTQYLCDQLGCKYLGGLSVIQLVFNISESTICLDIVAAHLLKTAQKLGTSINQVEALLSSFFADIAIGAHDHNRFALPTKPIIYVSHGHGKFKMKWKDRYVARSGSFLNTYRDGEKAYPVPTGMPPSALGTVKFIITPSKSINPNVPGKGIKIQAVC